MKNIITIIIGLLVGVSCIQIVELDFVHDTKLTFNCILNPDSVIRANLSLSKGINSTNDFEFIEGAAIKLFENGNLLGNFNNLGNGSYSYPYSPKIGHNYKVEIYKTGFPLCEAKTFVPIPTKIEFLKIPINTEENEYEITAKIYDPKGNDYYWYSHFSINRENGDKQISYRYDLYTSPYFDDFNKEIEPEAKYGYWYLRMLRLTDRKTDGELIQWEMDYWINKRYQHYKQILEVDEHYDKYLKTSIQMNMMENQTVALNEPVQIYSNVNNGYGIFGSNVVTVQLIK